MKTNLIDEIKVFILENKLYLLLLAFVCFLSYGFSITHYAVGIDNTNSSYYLDEMGMLAGGRMTSTLLDKILFPMNPIPFWSLSLGIMILYSSIVLLSMLLNSVAGGALTKGSLIIFGTVMASFPLVNEVLIYGHITYNACMLITALALYYTYRLFDGFSIKKVIPPLILMIFLVSYNESFCANYLLGLFIILILRFVTNKQPVLTFKKAIMFFLYGVCILIAAVVIEKLIEMVVLAILNPQIVAGADKSVMWKHFPFLTNLKLLIIGMFYRFFLTGFWYFPISIFASALIIAIVTAIVLSIKRKSGLILLLFLGLLLAVFSMSIIKGEATPYRMCSSFCIFTGFILMLFAQLLKGKWLKVSYGILMVILVLNQSRALNNWFVNDYQRYEYDKEVLLNVAANIEENHDVSKPVVFVGTIELAPQIKKGENNGSSFVNWGGFGGPTPGTENLEFLLLHGHEFNAPSEEQIEEALKIAEAMQIEYPKTGYIMETDDINIVNFGQNYDYIDYISEKEEKTYDAYVSALSKVFGWSYEYALGQLETAIN